MYCITELKVMNKIALNITANMYDYANNLERVSVL